MLFVKTNLLSEENEYDSKCGTFSPKKFKENKFPLKLEIPADRPDSILLPLKLQTAHFFIHYTLTGPNAVPLEDKNSNGCPDYIDSVAYYAEDVFNMEINNFGYTAPIPDSMRGGTDDYDLYILDMGNGVLNETFYGTTTDDGIVLQPEKQFPQFTSYIFIDNNFSGLDSTSLPNGSKTKTYYTTGIPALKITIAHEFHHAIQFYIGFDPAMITSIMEMSSIFMEYRIYPDVKDYYQFVNSLFNNISKYPFGKGTGSEGAGVGYRFGLFAQFLYHKYGDAVLKTMWDLIGNCNKSYKALDSALVLSGSNLDETWKEFMFWMYYTGERSISGKYFPEASDFPLLKYSNPNSEDQEYSAPSFLQSGYLKPYEIALYRCRFRTKDQQYSDDTVDVFMSSLDLTSAVNQTNRQSEFSSVLTDYEIAESKQIEGSDYYYSNKGKDERVFDTLLTYWGNITKTTGFEEPFPSPYNPSTDSELMFPVPASVKLYDEAELLIYSNEMTSVYCKEKKVGLYNSYRVIICDDLPSDISSGVYIYKLKYKNSEILGKFIVKR